MAFKCIIVTAEQALYNSEAVQITVPGKSGGFSIRTGHAPVMAILTRGTIDVSLGEKDIRKICITSGVVEFKENTCTIMCDEEKTGDTPT